jgi:transglutaminase-like putative cysteine protease
MTARLRLTAVAALATLLAALSLSAEFRDGAWVWPVVLAIVVGSGGCALARRLGVPRVLVPVVGLAALVLLATWLYARTNAIFGVFPGPGAVRDLRALLTVASKDMQRFASPAPTTQALLMLTVLGVGAAAVAVDTLAVTCRSAALAGAPLLALYAVPSSLSHGGVSWVLFAAAAVGWLALMLAEGRERLAGWGRALGRRSSRGDGIFTGAPAEPLGVVGRRIGAAALGMALVLPAIVPVFSGGLFGSGGSGSGSGSGTGSGTAGAFTSINPLVGIASDLTSRDNIQVFTYTSNDPNPDYLRMVTLDRFDGTNWQVAHLQPSGPAAELPAGLTATVPGTRVVSQINMTGLRTSWLPLPYPAQSIQSLSGNWVYDLATSDVFAQGNDTTLGRNYDVTSVHPALTPTELRAAGSGSAADVSATDRVLPANLPPQVQALTNSLVKGKTTDYDKALAIEQFFLDPKNKFTYTTEIPGYKGSALVAFLTNRKGFCQQFATTFGVMARQAGLATRINVGFTQGFEKTAGSQVWVVARQNAHAWPEVYFHGLGWVRFEPTPGPSGVQPPTYAPGPGPNTPSPVTPSGAVTQSAHNGARDDLDIGADTTTAKAATAAAAPTKRHWLVAAAVVLVLLVLVAPSVARVARRRRRLHVRGGFSLDSAGRTLAAWREVIDTGRDLGLTWAPSRTARRTAENLVTYGVQGDAADAVRRLARAVERVRYAPGGFDLGAEDPGADARLVTQAMEAASPPKVRWRARLLPASVLAVAGAKFAGALDAVDSAGARLRGGIGRLLPARVAGTR